MREEILEPQYEILREESDSQNNLQFLPIMLPRVSTTNRFDAVAIFAQMINESPHLHLTLRYKPKFRNTLTKRERGEEIE